MKIKKYIYIWIARQLEKHGYDDDGDDDDDDYDDD